MAQALKEKLNADLYTGKDYLRLHKNELMAERMFVRLLSDAVQGDNVIYVIAEKEHMKLIPEGAYRILVTEELSVIKERFADRMHGNLPAPVAVMLEKKHGSFDLEPCDLHIHAGQPSAEQVFQTILNR